MLAAPANASVAMTTVERLHANGILRTGTPTRGFRHKRAAAGKIGPDDLARIEQLKIPPAWTDVAISSAATGRVQAVGKDAAGRWQYIYHESHVRTQQRKKFARLIKFGESLPAMTCRGSTFETNDSFPRARDGVNLENSLQKFHAARK